MSGRPFAFPVSRCGTEVFRRHFLALSGIRIFLLASRATGKEVPLNWRADWLISSLGFPAKLTKVGRK